MHRNNIIIILTAIVIGIVIYVIINKKGEKYASPLIENFTIKPFSIFNHLNKPIYLKINKFNTLIEANKSINLTPYQVNEYLKNGNIIEVFLLDRTKYADYVIDMPYDNIRIKELHIGMMTDRSIGSTDVFRSTVTNSNAVRGLAYTNIHNLSALPLNLQVGSITYNIKPYEVYKYKGYLHTGIALGTIFKNLDGLYNDYVYLKPYSDIYYGLTSDENQPPQGEGGLQFSFYDKVQYGQTLWPFEDGIY